MHQAKIPFSLSKLHAGSGYLILPPLNEREGMRDSTDDVKGWKRAGLPGAGEVAGDAGNVQAVEVAEEDLAQIQVNERLQRLHSCRPLQREQRAVIMHSNVNLAAVRLRATSEF